MSKFSNDGHKLNHQILSPCTKRSVRANLAAAHRIFCLWKTDATFCGDGILEENKDCDCENVFAMYFASRSCWRKNDIRSAMISCNVTKLSRFHCLDRLQRNLLWIFRLWDFCQILLGHRILEPINVLRIFQSRLSWQILKAFFLVDKVNID